MRLSPSINIASLLCFGLMCGCRDVKCDGHARLTISQDLDMYHAIQIAWPKYAANSLCCHSAGSLAQWDEGCRNSFNCLQQRGYELKWVYKLSGWFLLEAQDARNGRTIYLKLGRTGDGGVDCRAFDLKEKSWLNVGSYAGSLRFAPIVEDTTVGFTEMWDSLSDTIVSVPDGFHALIQAGAGVFLLRKDADGEYYRWNAINKLEPKRWKYFFPEGWNVRSSYFIARSSENGKRYAFAVGLEPIPNSEGAMAISPCGAYKGRQYYGVWKGSVGGQRFYYAWPEKDSSEPLSNGTETFGGGSVVFRDGRLVVLSPTGPTPVDEF